MYHNRYSGLFTWGATFSSIHHELVTVVHLFSTATNFTNGLKKKFEEAIFTNLHRCLLFSLQSVSQ